MNKIILKKGLSTLTMVPIAFPIYAFGWEPAGHQNNRVKEQLNLNSESIQGILDSGIANMNEDVGVLEVYLTASEAKTSPIIELTREEPVVMAVEDAQHDRATIQAISSQRHSDGSATVKQKTINPDDFKRKSEGGMLTDKQYEILISAYGGANPADVFNGQGGNRNTWYGVDSHETQTMMGLIMQFLGATHGYYVLLEPQVRSWTTSSGGPLTKKITTHVEAHVKPHWTFLTPIDVGSNYGTPNIPLFQIKGKDNKTYVVRGGVNAFAIGPTNNFNTGREFLHYEKESQTGFTGFALVLAAVAVGVLTGGAGLIGAFGAASGGAMAGGAALAGLTISGAELHDPVADGLDGLLLQTAAAGLDSRKKDLETGFGNNWRHELIDVMEDGPLDGSKAFNNDMRRELNQWDTIIKPN